MNLIITIVVVVLQVIAGQLLGFGTAVALGVGDGWELVVIPAGNTLGVWGVGVIAAKLRHTFTTQPYQMRLIGTAVGSMIGVVIILVTPAIGFVQLLFPLGGAMLGYYLPHWARRLESSSMAEK